MATARVDAQTTLAVAIKTLKLDACQAELDGDRILARPLWIPVLGASPIVAS